MRAIRTDLAMESVGAGRPYPGGVSVKSETDRGVTVTTICISSEESAREIGRSPGRYITITADALPKCDAEQREYLSSLVEKALSELLPERGEVLVVGLGNRHVTADALGTRIVERLIVTRHLRGSLARETLGKLRGVSAIAPGVLGVTGIETAELCKGLVGHVKPGAVIALDALAAFDSKRICTTIQLTDTGIDPGSGVGNHRLGLNETTLGVPVIAIGVPMVVYASTIVRDVLFGLIESYDLGGDVKRDDMSELIKKHSESLLGEMVVTPREIDEMVVSVAEILAQGVNRALHPRLDKELLDCYMRR